MLTNSNIGCSGAQDSIRPSVIKVTRSCCSKRNTEAEYQDKLTIDIQLTHQNYMKVHQENNCLTLQVDNLDSRLKDQNYQYACLKYELEQYIRKKCELVVKLNNLPKEESKAQLQVADSSNQLSVQKSKLCKKSACHASDLEKLPDIFCLCGVQLKSEQILKDHIRYHNSKARFGCKICGLKTNGLNLLKHHMKKRHDLTDFNSSKGCRTCGKLFTTLEQLHEHRRREHGRKRKREIWGHDTHTEQNIIFPTVEKKMLD